MNANKAVVPFFQFPVLHFFYLVFCFGILACTGQESKGSITSQAANNEIQQNERPKSTILRIDILEKPYSGYAFYDEDGMQVKIVNLRLFPTLNPFNKPEVIHKKQDLTSLIYDNENDTLNKIIKYDLKKISPSERSRFIEKYINKDIPRHIIDSIDLIVSTPNGTALSGTRNQFLIVQSTVNFVKSDTTVWSNTYISVYDYMGVVRHEFVLNGEVSKTEISDDGQFLLSELIKRYYGYEEYYEFVGLLMSNLSTKEGVMLKPDIVKDDILIDIMRFQGKYFVVTFNRDSPMGLIYLMLVSPYDRKIYQKQIFTNNMNEWSQPKPPDGSAMDLRGSKESSF